MGVRMGSAKAGTYLISVEITDDDGDVTVIQADAEVVVLPRLTSQVPEITIMSEYNGMSFTNQSSLRFTARASDPDGKMEYVQFYINGEPLGAKITSQYIDDQFQQPYSVAFSPQQSGVYTVFAVARDNSGNYVMSDTVSFTTTFGEGAAPTIRLTRPTMAGEGTIETNFLGEIVGFNLTNNGFSYIEPPTLNIFGLGFWRVLSVDVETDRNSPTYGELKDAKVIASGVGYDNETIVQFEGGFEPLKASGSVAKHESFERLTDTQAKMVD